MASVLALVFAFRSSAALAFAFGMAVTATILITTLLFFYLARIAWRWPLWRVLVGAGGFLVVDALFLAANITKLLHGAWLPLLIAIGVFTVMTTWQRGRAVVTERRKRIEGPLRDFVEDLHNKHVTVRRVPGTAVFLNRGSSTTPLALRANVVYNHVLHRKVVILSVETRPVPFTATDDRLRVDDLGHDDGMCHVTASFGYMEDPNVPEVISQLARDPDGPRLDVEGASYFLSTLSIYAGPEKSMPRWQKRLFLATSRLTSDAADYFGLPRNRTVLMGSRLEL